jgi:hypothetical protein
MSTPETKEEFIQYCLRALGEPVIKVNISPEQADDRVSEALKLFYERHYNGVEEVYILFDITDREKAQKYILLDKDIVGVTECFRPISSGNIFDFAFQYQLSDLYATSSMYRFGDITYYYINKSYLTMLNRFFSPDRQFSFNPLTHRLMIAGGMKDTDNMDGGVILKAYKKIYGEDAEAGDDDTNNIVGNVWEDRWLQKYVTALLKKQWSQNLSKFRELPMLGGVVLNGQQMMQEANIEIEKLEHQLDTEYSYPPAFFVG